MTFSPTFGRVFSPTFKPNSLAPAVAGGWWLTGGIAAANCIAAYQAKGAASYAASKVNLNNAGTNDAANGAAYPTWDASYGWSFTAASLQYLTTPITPASGYSMIIRYTDKAAGNTFICGEFYTTKVARFFINPDTAANAVGYGSGSNLNVAPKLTSGVLAIAGQQGYRDGAADGAAIGNWTGTTPYQIYIGALMISGAAGNFATCKIQAFAVYNTTVSAAQIAALTTAMNLL